MTNPFGYFKAPPRAQAGEEPATEWRAPSGDAARLTGTQRIYMAMEDVVCLSADLEAGLRRHALIRHATTRWRMAMQRYAGSDVSMKETSICTVDEKRKVVREGKVRSEPDTIAA